MDEFWYMYVKQKVFDKIKKKSMPYLSKYEGIYFTDQAVVRKPPSFPCVEITELPGVEAGMTLENEDVAGYLATFQVKVYSEKSEDVARDVMSEIANHFKKDLHFSMTAMPITTQNGDNWVGVIRFRRMIGGGDKL